MGLFRQRTNKVTLTAGAGTVTKDIPRIRVSSGHMWLFGVQIIENNAGESVKLKIVDTSRNDLPVVNLGSVTQEYYAIRDAIYNRDGQVIPGASTPIVSSGDLRAEITGGTSGNTITISVWGAEYHPDTGEGSNG